MSLVQTVLTGPFNFLGRGQDELRRVLPDADRILPAPQRIYFDDENATPIVGFPVLSSPELSSLHRAFDA